MRPGWAFREHRLLIRGSFDSYKVMFRFVSLHVAVSRAWLLGMAGRSLGEPLGTGVHKLHQQQVVHALHQLMCSLLQDEC